MNSYKANTGGSSSEQVSGWEQFNIYGTSNASSQPPNSNAYDYPYNTMQHQQQGSQEYANQYYTAAQASITGLGRPGYSLGIPSMVGGYYDHPQGAQRSSNQSNDVSNRLGNHIDEINAGIARQHRISRESREHHYPPVVPKAVGMLGQSNSQGGTHHHSGECPDYSIAGGQQQQAAFLTENNTAESYGMGNVPRMNDPLLRELDYCDLLLRGLSGSTAVAPTAANNQMIQNQLMWNIGGQPTMWPSSAATASQSTTSKAAAQSSSTNKIDQDFFMNSMHQPYSSSVAKPSKSSTVKCSKPVSSASLHDNLNSSSTPHQTTSTPSAYFPHSNSSQPEKQIDPLLETISLSIPSVSLEKLTGNEVIMHIRCKTDDVITRFLPCVDFLVNCQQELRQGLTMANRRTYVTTNGRSRTSTAMTPHQFFVKYIAPLPSKFERKNDYLMAREHLVAAKLQLDHLVKEAQNVMPQGCEQVKTTFLGGMRENESWGLRKWLSKHGGAGSICNDLEEVLRTIKALKKEEKTTIKLAELLRPIASQAHDRLKKDVPQAYQEQSTAHPYLPFFHRLEACLKQMANYDPEDDDVILLDSDDDEVEDVKVLEKKVTEAPKSSAVKKRILKREREDDSSDAQATATEMHLYKRGKTLQNLGTPSPLKIEKKEVNGKQQEVICLDDTSDEEDEKESTQILTLEGGMESPSQTPQPPETQNNVHTFNNVSGLQRGWRCEHCTCLNAPNVSICTMCNDDVSTGWNDADELANFLGGGFMDDSNHTSEF